MREPSGGPRASEEFAQVCPQAPEPAEKSLHHPSFLPADAKTRDHAGPTASPLGALPSPWDGGGHLTGHAWQPAPSARLPPHLLRAAPVAPAAAATRRCYLHLPGCSHPPKNSLLLWTALSSPQVSYHLCHADRGRALCSGFPEAGSQVAPRSGRLPSIQGHCFPLRFSRLEDRGLTHISQEMSSEREGD